MDIDLEQSVKETFKNAFHRIDGMAMYFVLSVFVIQAFVFFLTN